MANYIDADDITDKVISDTFDLTDYLAESTEAVNDLAERRGVRDSDNIETDPVHFKVKRYAIEYVIMRVCQDNIGVNNVESIDFEKYSVKYTIAKQMVKQLDTEISIEMLTGSVDEIRDRANIHTAKIFRS